MARFQLVIRPDGQALLATTERLSAEQLKVLKPLLDDWHEGRSGLLVVGECEVVQVRDVTIDLEREATEARL